MAQNMKPPAYQEYAANILADRNFRLMTLAERGLFYSMRLECWLNSNVPATPRELAKYLGYEVSDIESALTDKLKSFFLNQGQDFICPELEDYRQHLNEQKKRQSEGGRKGAKSTNSKHNQQASDLQVPRQDTRESLVKSSLAKYSKTQPLKNGDINDEWINEYETAEGEKLLND